MREERNLLCDAHVGGENKRTWALKINRHDGVLSFRTSVYFYVYDKFTVVGCHDHNLNTEANGKILIQVNAPKSGRREVDPACCQRHIKMAISIMT